MSEFGDIEIAVVDALSALMEGESPLFAEVAGGAFADRRSRDERLLHAKPPAAIVSVDGRVRRGANDPLPGSVRVTVALADRNLRSANGARLGDVDGHGVFLVAQRVTAALSGAILDSVWRLSESDERIVTADERQVVIEQSWIAEQPASLTLPTFGGANILGSGAVVTIEPGEVQASTSEFSFPGVDGVFLNVLGRTSRAIVWRGVFRADSHAELTAIESAVDALVGTGQSNIVTDAFGRSYADCVAAAFELKGPRRTHPATGQAVQAFELTFMQLAG